MGIFGDNKAETDLLAQQLQASETQRKRALLALKEARELVAALEARLNATGQELAEARRRIARGRERQRALLERANRYKAKLAASPTGLQ